jgi:hypothetical protein
LPSFGDNSIFLFRITKPALPTATVCINCQELDRVVWTPPYQITLPRDLRANGNQLEIRVANTWWNRLLADQVLPKEKRLTRTNVTPKAGGKPLPSGLFGPVRILTPAD